MKSRDATLIIGPGRVGSTLAVALQDCGWPLVAIGGRHPAGYKTLATRLDPNIFCGRLDELASRYGSAFPVVLLTVPDDVIAEVAGIAVEQGLVDRNSVVLHVSGFCSGQALAAVSSQGGSVGSMHPLQTFTGTGDAVSGCHWFVEGDEQAIEISSRMVSCLEGIFHLLRGENKTLYHAAASIASNLMTGLVDAALETAGKAGLDHGEMLGALAPLLLRTVNNLIQLGPELSLTGPVSRGDVETVRAHVEALSKQPDILALYRLLASRTIDIAVRSGRIDEQCAAEIKRVVTDFDHPSSLEGEQ